MKRLIVTCAAVLAVLSGCRPSEPSGGLRPELVRISSLPPLDPFVHPARLTINLLFCIVRDGSVVDVRMLGTSGDAQWDAAALDSMKHWRFAGLGSDTPEEGIWIRQTVQVKAEERVVMTLGELTVAGEREADSLYALLKQGVAFEVLLKNAGGPSSAAIIGPVDIAQYPGRVRDRLRELDLYEVTPPIRVGVRYVIYQRLDGDKRD